jgi:DNA primase
MNISEQVLSSTLAQVLSKDIADVGKRLIEENKAKAMKPVQEGAETRRES